MSIAPHHIPPNTVFIGDDDLPVTMQIGMIGKDGIVLASDTKWSTTWIRSERARIQELRDEYGSSKILIAPGGRLAVSCADDMIVAFDVAKAILSAWNPEADDSECSALKEIVKPFCSHRAFQCIVASTRPVAELVYVSHDLRLEPQLSITRVLDRICAGDRANAAKFWHLRYYDHNLPTTKLRSLAAQLITDAAAFNNGITGGFDLAVTEAGVFRKVPKPECDSLAELAQQRSRSVSELIFGSATLPQDITEGASLRDPDC